MSWLYDLLLALALPILALQSSWQRWRTGKQFPTLRQRLGFDLPDNQGRSTIWIHCVSVGEVKAAAPLVKLIRCSRPEAFILVTTASATGQEEARRTLFHVDAVRFLPLDIRWVVERWVRRLRPILLLFIEGDLWPQLMRSVKKWNGKVALASGKLSERSAARYARVPVLARALLAPLDLLLVQSETYRRRFLPFSPVEPVIAGNLKLDPKPQSISRAALAPQLGPGPWLALSCTHSPEEKLLLPQLIPFLSRFRLLLAPRHPERAAEVAQILRSHSLSFCTFGTLDCSAPIVLVDRLGVLAECYACSEVAIVGGSFFPGIGGHNILEPILQQCPAIFGPHMETQHELAELALSSHCAVQASADQLGLVIEEVIQHHARYREACSGIPARLGKVAEQTWEKIRPFC
jgi:3-deoxy-D-manno-octulosonic-acid transferase